MTYIQLCTCTSGDNAVNTKLTLRLDDALIRSAKRHSRKSGKSISRLVADYFAVIGAGEKKPDADLTPKVRSLLGALATSRVNEDDYRRSIEKKHK
jgi:hypothetical protein